MKRLVILVAVVALLIALLISGLSDTTALVADTGISDNDKASSVTETDNSSASATITITMTTASNNEADNEQTYLGS